MLMAVIEWTAVATVAAATVAVAVVMKFVPWVIRRGITDVIDKQTKEIRDDLELEKRRRRQVERRIWDAIEGRTEW